MRSVMEIIKYVGCCVLVFLPVCVYAQYDPQGVTYGGNTISAVTFAAMRFFARSLMWIALTVIIYLFFRALIAGVLYITSGGDEDRMDTAFTWWKQSATWFVFMMIVYVCANIFSDVGVKVSVL